MSIKKKIKNYIAKKLRINPLLARGMIGNRIYPDFKNLENTAAYRAISVAGSCIDQIASDFMQLPFNIFDIQLKSNGDIIKTNVTLDDRFKSIRIPNEFQTRAQFIRKFIQHDRIVGEVFIEPVYAISSQPPVELHLHNPNNISIQIEKNGIAGYIEEINANTKEWSPEELIYICNEDAFKSLRGIAPLSFLTSETALEWHAMKFANSFFKNGARFSNIISFDTDIGADEMQEYNDKFVNKFSGSTNSFQTILLDNNAKLQETGTNQSDMLFLQQIEYVDRRICGQFGVPTILVGIADQSGLGNDVIRAQMFLYWSTTMQSQAAKVADSFTHRLLPLYEKPGENLTWEYDFSKIEYLQRDQQVVFNTQKEKVLNGQITFGEYVVLGGGDPIEDQKLANRRFMPFAVQTLESAIDPFNEEESQDVVVPEKPDENPDPDAKQIFKTNIDILLENKQRTAQFRRHEKERDKTEDRYRKDYIVIANIQEQMVLASLNRLDKSFTNGTVHKSKLKKSDIKVIQIPIQLGTSQMKRGLKNANKKAVESAEKLVAIEIGLPVQQVQIPSAFERKLIASREKLYPGSIADTNNKILRVLEKGIAQDKDIIDISKDIRQMFDNTIKKSKADLIARTESVSVTNGASVESMKVAGVEKKMWITARDNDVRDEHVLMDGEVVGINEQFSNGSDYPDDFNERCIAVPVSPTEKNLNKIKQRELENA